MILAPIVLFVYNRLDHTKKTIEALQKNELAKESELFIYSDEAKNDEFKQSVNEVRAYIDNIDGFKKVMVIKREKNWGLANSIIDGVTKTVNNYGKIIVLEDDLVTSPYFLKFMNEALDFYEDEEKVWHISGWNYPIETEGLDDIFLWRLMNCWGWATWANKWKYFEKDIDKTLKEFTKDNIEEFNLDGGENFFSQVIKNHEKKINTWAIFWYITIFKEKGLCVNPTRTFVENIGHDGSGVHCGINESYTANISYNNKLKFLSNIVENKLALSRIRLFYKLQHKTIFARVANRILRFIGKRDLLK